MAKRRGREERVVRTTERRMIAGTRCGMWPGWPLVVGREWMSAGRM